METYHHSDTSATTPDVSFPAMEHSNNDNRPDDYDRHHRWLLTQSLANEGWRSKLSHYLKDIPDDVTKDTDIVSWWGVCTVSSAS
jgi:hypothetical protein